MFVQKDGRINITQINVEKGTVDAQYSKAKVYLHALSVSALGRVE
jgi:hypothetical protein